MQLLKNERVVALGAPSDPGELQTPGDSGGPREAPGPGDSGGPGDRAPLSSGNPEYRALRASNPCYFVESGKRGVKNCLNSMDKAYR